MTASSEKLKNKDGVEILISSNKYIDIYYRITLFMCLISEVFMVGKETDVKGADDDDNSTPRAAHA